MLDWVLWSNLVKRLPVTSMKFEKKSLKKALMTLVLRIWWYWLYYRKLCRWQYAIPQWTGKVIKKLETSICNLFRWFEENHTKINADKCHLFVTTKSPVSSNIGEFIIIISNEGKCFGIKIDTTLKNYVSSLCNKASQKLHLLDLITSLIDHMDP